MCFKPRRVHWNRQNYTVRWWESHQHLSMFGWTNRYIFKTRERIREIDRGCCNFYPNWPRRSSGKSDQLHAYCKQIREIVNAPQAVWNIAINDRLWVTWGQITKLKEKFRLRSIWDWIHWRTATHRLNCYLWATQTLGTRVWDILDLREWRDKGVSELAESFASRGRKLKGRRMLVQRVQDFERVSREPTIKDWNQATIRAALQVSGRRTVFRNRKLTILTLFVKKIRPWPDHPLFLMILEGSRTSISANTSIWLEPFDLLATFELEVRTSLSRATLSSVFCKSRVRSRQETCLTIVSRYKSSW